MARETCSRRGRAAAAFTLVELLLTVALMLLLAGAVIINFGSLGRNARLEEGASHLETLFRYARSQAASTGRRVKIVFDSGGMAAGSTTNATPSATISGGTNMEVRVLWEPEPVDGPGRFESFPGADLLVGQVNDLVTVREVHPLGADPAAVDNAGIAAMPILPSAGNTNGTSLMDVTPPSLPSFMCYPDGSSDSVEIVVAAVDSEDKRLAVVTFSGLNGRARHRLIAPAVDGAPPTTETGRVDSKGNQ